MKDKEDEYPNYIIAKNIKEKQINIKKISFELFLSLYTHYILFQLFKYLLKYENDIVKFKSIFERSI